MVTFNIFRKVDENSAEGEIREAFTVFDSVSHQKKKHSCQLYIPGWQWIYKPTRIGVCHGQSGNDHGTRRDSGESILL